MRTIRQAIPFDEIAANMQNSGKSCKSSRYSRKNSYISEQEADARVAIVGITFGSMAIIAICLGLWIAWHGISTAQAHEGPIYIKSELSKSQIKQLNIMPARSETHGKR